jgi:hypothetical protein
VAIKDDLPEGLYVVRNLAKTTMCLDVSGGGVANGSNIQVYTNNYTRAQTWRLKWNDDGTAYLISVCNGKAMDADSNNLKKGGNVQCWDYYAGRNQCWTISKGTQTATVGDKTLQAYYMQVKGTSYYAECYGQASEIADGTNVQLYTKLTDKDQQWLFDPLDKITDGGVYEVRTMTKTSNCLDSTNGYNTTVGNNVQAYARNNTNAQKWVFIKDGTNWKIRQGGSKLVLDAGTGSIPASGRNVQIYSDNTSRNQRWALETVSTTVLAGDDLPVVRIKPTANTSTSLDVTGAGTSNGTNVWVYKNNEDTAAQKWALVPTTLVDPTMPVPSIAGWTSNLTVAHSATASFHTTKSLYLNGTCPQSWSTKGGNSFRIRWRTRNFTAKGVWSAWGSYCSWRTPLMRTNKNQWWFTQNFAQTSMDYKSILRKAVQFEMCTQGVDEYSNITGEIATKTIYIDYTPTPKFTSATLSPEGLIVTYTVDYDLPITFYLTSATVDNKALLKKAYTVVGDDETNTFTIPFNYLRRIPANGSTLSFAFSIGTDVHGKYGTALTQTCKMDYHDGSVDKHLVLKNDNAAGMQAKYYFADANDEVSLLTSDGSLYPLTKTGSYWLVPKFMEDITVIAKWESADGTQWATCADTIKASTVAFHGFTWGEEDGVIIWLNRDEVLKENRDITTDATEHTLLGRPHPYVSYTANQVNNKNWTKVSATVEGYILPERLEDYGTTPASVERMLEVGYCLYRSPKGRISTVAVTDASLTFERDLIQISVTYTEVSL